MEKHYDQYGNLIERVSTNEQKTIDSIIRLNRNRLEKIKESKKCFGDKVREIVNNGITNNIVYARKILERL